MNIDDIRCWFQEFGVRGLGVIRSTPRGILLEFADLTTICIEEAPLGRCNVSVQTDGMNEPSEYQGLDLQALIGLLHGMGIEVKS